ncbi:hypothetical protein BDF14DRAFT_1784979 [Spinellus fusiger]|nr:hypothetical protein BDF14DRAFT_1784979 [Spinellus fusiger]
MPEDTHDARRLNAGQWQRPDSTASPLPAPHVSWLRWPMHITWRLALTLLSLATRLVPRFSFPLFVPTDPQGAAAAVVRSFEKKYGSSHVPFHADSYTSVLKTAQKNLQLCLVILQSEEHDATHTFCSETLTSEDMMEAVQRMDVLVWMGSVSDPEAFQVSSLLQATTYPFLALLAFPVAANSGEGAIPTQLVVADRMEGAISAQDIVRRMVAVQERHAPVYTRMRSERRKRERERELLREQARAYQESLRADQEKKQREKEEMEALALAQEETRLEAQRMESMQRTLQEKKDQYIAYLYSQLEEEPHPKHPQVTRLSFRLANGTRLVRSFHAHAPLVTLYQFIAVYPLIERNEAILWVDPPEDYEHTYDFSIVSSYPRVTYPPSSDCFLFQQEGLWPSATLIVEETED